MEIENNNMKSNKCLIWKPERRIRIIILTHLFSMVIIIIILIIKLNIISIIAGILLFLFNLWQFMCSFNVMRTYFTTNDKEIAMIHPSFTSGIYWKDIKKVIIRERKKLNNLHRPDRIIIIIGVNDRKIPINSSTFSIEKEELLLNEIRQKVSCPIEVIQDALI